MFNRETAGKLAILFVALLALAWSIYSRKYLKNSDVNTVPAPTSAAVSVVTPASPSEKAIVITESKHHRKSHDYIALPEEIETVAQPAEATLPVATPRTVSIEAADEAVMVDAPRAVVTTPTPAAVTKPIAKPPEKSVVAVAPVKAVAPPVVVATPAPTPTATPFPPVVAAPVAMATPIATPAPAPIEQKPFPAPKIEIVRVLPPQPEKKKEAEPHVEKPAPAVAKEQVYVSPTANAFEAPGEIHPLAVEKKIVQMDAPDAQKFTIDKNAAASPDVARAVSSEAPTPAPIAAAAPIIAPTATPAPDQRQAVQPPAQTLSDWKQGMEKAGMKLFAGLGIYYYHSEEKLSDVDANYNGFKGPSYYFGLMMDVVGAYAVIVDYFKAALDFNNSSIGAEAQHSDLQLLNIDVLKRLESNKDLSIAFGLQMGQLPLTLFDESTNAPIIVDTQFLSVDAGANWTHDYNARTRIVISGRVQYPLMETSSGRSATFSVSNPIMFSGSVGVDKRIKEDMWLGVHWHGFYHQFNYQYGDANVQAAGSHSIILSTPELRMTYDF